MTKVNLIENYLQRITDPNVISAFKVLISTLADKQDEICGCLDNHQIAIEAGLDRIQNLESKVSNLSDKTIYGEYVD